MVFLILMLGRFVIHDLELEDRSHQSQFDRYDLGQLILLKYHYLRFHFSSYCSLAFISVSVGDPPCAPSFSIDIDAARLPSLIASLRSNSLASPTARPPLKVSPAPVVS